MAQKKTVWEKNFAEIGEIRDRVREHFIPRLRDIRENRLELEQNWIRFHNMWNVTHDEYHSYQGRARLYVPEVRKNVESMARILTTSAFPGPDFFDCSPGLTGTKRGAIVHKSVRKWQLEQMKIRPKFHIFARQECLYGTSPIRIEWSKKMQHIFMSARDPKTGKIKPTRQMVELYNAPEFKVVDLFKWFALNPKKLDHKEDGCAEIDVIGKFELEARNKSGWLHGFEDIVKGNTDAYRLEELERDVERAESIGLRVENLSYAGEADVSERGEEEPSGQYMLARIFAPMVIPEACLPDEDPKLPVPMEIHIYGNQFVGTVRRNPFFHQTDPYLVGRYIMPDTDNAYGQGIPWAIQYMQYEVNSKAEQAMDSATLALNPLAFVDPGLAAQLNDFSIEPGGIWFVNPQGVKFAQIPDTTQTGYNAINQLRAQMTDYSDRSPALPPQLLGKSRTATQSDIVAQSVQIDHQSFAAQNEIDVLQPMLQMMESLTDQNITGDQLVMILGRRATDWKRSMVTKQQTLGKYEYFWKGASMQQNRQIIARQMLDAIKVAATIPPTAGLKFDYNEAYKILYTEGWGLHDADKVLGLPEEMVKQDPEVLYRMLKMGLDVEVNPGDDEQVAIRFFNEKLKTEKNDALKAEMVRLIFMYEKQAELKASIKRAQEFQAQIQMLQAQGGHGDLPFPDPTGSKQRRKSTGSGNRTQLSPNGSAGNMGSGTRA